LRQVGIHRGAREVPDLGVHRHRLTVDDVRVGQVVVFSGGGRRGSGAGPGRAVETGLLVEAEAEVDQTERQQDDDRQDDGGFHEVASPLVAARPREPRN
jgi:hypothetical protein